MAKKILAIFFVSILLCSYIIPTTSAFADVVIGDNDSYAVTELGVENGKKIATMEAMLQLLESGVSEINFNDISDLEDYLEEFYDELNNVNYNDVSNELLAGAYNDVKELKQWIDDRGEYIATYYKDYLNSADQGLTDIFNQFQMKLPKSKLVGTSLNGFRSLSRFNCSSPTPTPPTDYDVFVRNITGFTIDGVDILTASLYYNNRIWNNRTSYSYYKVNSISDGFHFDQINMYASNPITLYINGSDNVGWTMTTQVSRVTPWAVGTNYRQLMSSLYNFGNNSIDFSLSTTSYSDSGITSHNSDSLTTMFNWLNLHFRHCNIYVNGEPWGLISPIATPTLDIDGFIKLYGNDNPIQYEFPQGTQIDYNALYTTIYNAIHDNLPLDMQTVNNNQVYYDSHDTVYSPTIYNYYGKDGDDENDWIDSILDYATIPDFNSVLGTVAVLDAPFVNGITIVNAGVTDVIPTDILLILGGFFVLVLFVCIINRMSE